MPSLSALCPSNLSAMKALFATIRSSLLILLLLVSYYIMLTIIFQYTALRDDIGFLRLKQAYVHTTIWKAAFYIHVFSSIFTLAAGLTQFSNGILARYPKFHRIAGRIYVYDILLINFPTGMVLAVTALGHWPSKLAFITLDCLWWWFTYKGVTMAIQRHMIAHKQFMIRSYALTCSAITLRIGNTFLIPFFHIEPMLGYTLFAWLGFVPNLLFAEWLIRRTASRRKTKLSLRGFSE